MVRSAPLCCHAAGVLGARLRADVTLLERASARRRSHTDASAGAGWTSFRYVAAR
jgi:hypothetical protein